MQKRKGCHLLQSSLHSLKLLLGLSLLLGAAPLHAAEQSTTSSPCPRMENPAPAEDRSRNWLILVMQVVTLDDTSSSGYFDWEDLPDHPNVNGSGGCSPSNP
ncbi:MAG: hypothetical protein ACKO6N_00320 [Myxococcota bacterium]